MSTNGLGHVGCRKQVTEALGKEGVVVRKAHRHTHRQIYIRYRQYRQHIQYKQHIQYRQYRRYIKIMY